MTAPVTRDQLMAVVEGSPKAVGAHDRSTWVALFAGDGQINDPVGSRPHNGTSAIESFYDTFIAPNTITFYVERDIVCGQTVWRDLSLATEMSTGVVLNVPMHLRYDVVGEPDDLRIGSLYAHWELATMLRQLAAAGFDGLKAGAKLTPQLLSNQGIGGALGFSRGILGVGAKGKQAATRFLDAATVGRTPPIPVELPAGTHLSPADVNDLLTGMTRSKVLAAGRTVTVSVVVCGEPGIALFGFEPKGHRINRVQFFTES
ncbi:ketosteroid isomerase family protein [Rhodococcus sp. ARC_M6]|uniref:nuclear transport factor 2 family protein n=1 Tax=Rhodococcus sp. ARC_M6 TaxID=2928852 RepID=UPI001FB421AB|nr:ketosteroid isomerase family protein [Rhodococcus sp. ARC_M6]MCJ0905722.1 ketosteroid isomerase family protein [Rhodococcus sp. ARC_M6]